MLMKKKKQSRLRSFRKFQGVSELSKASTRNPGGTYQGRIVMETSHKIGHNPKHAKYIFVFPICFPPKLILYFQKSFDFSWTHVFHDCNMAGSLPLLVRFPNSLAPGSGSGTSRYMSVGEPDYPFPGYGQVSDPPHHNHHHYDHHHYHFSGLSQCHASSLRRSAQKTHHSRK